MTPDITPPIDETWRKASGRGRPGQEPPIPRGLPSTQDTSQSFDETMAELDANIKRIKAEIGREEAAFEPPDVKSGRKG